MKATALTLILLSVLSLNSYAQETIEVSNLDKQAVSEELDRKADETSDTKTKEFLKKISLLFKKSKDAVEVEVKKVKSDCADCSQKERTKGILTRLGRDIGKGSSWLSTKTAKPFMATTGFFKGLFEKKGKNDELLAMYKFFLNHQEEFDGLYKEAGTPDEMVELMMTKAQMIIENKAHIIMKDFLVYLGINKDLSGDFELSDEEIAKIDLSKVNADFINRHPEYQELRPFLGDLTDQEMKDIVTSGYFGKAISLERAQEGLPKPYELAVTVASQVVVPQMALGVISTTLAGLYATPVVVADIGTGVSAAICLQKSTQDEFSSDADLKQFCSYVTNKTSYELLKSKAKGYVSGRKIHTKLTDKIKKFKERREQKKKEKEAAKLALR